MPKVIEVDRDELDAAIELVEENGPLPNLAALYNQVSEAMGGTPSPQVVKARILTWQIQVKTQPGRKRKTKPEIPPPPLIPSAAQNRMLVYTPAGKCPYRLTGTDPNSIAEWADRVREHGLANGMWYLPHALIYYTRQFYDIFTPEYNAIKEIIKALPDDSLGE